MGKVILFIAAKVLNNSDCEEYGPLGCNAVQLRDSLIFHRKMLPPSSGLKTKLKRKPMETSGTLQATQCYSTADNLLKTFNFFFKRKR
jgi:hypothetical protein